MKPFKIRIPKEKITDLRRRLEKMRWPDSIDADDWGSGVPLNYLKELVDYWKDEYGWFAQQELLNSFAHYKSVVDGFGIHFIHERSSDPDALPLLLIHGWPGSFWEMQRIIPMLTTPDKYGADPSDAFHVVVPSLPGYGFSDRPAKHGMNGPFIASLFEKLMKQLGYSKFVAQGGDWGATVATWLGLHHPASLTAIHLNYIPGSYRPYVESNDTLSESEQEFLKHREEWYQKEGGYAHIQATKPQTLAYALNDSPAGLAAWIVEKFQGWSDCDGNVENRFSKDELLTNISIYWFTETFHSSARLYQEALKAPVHMSKGMRVEVPGFVACFPKEDPMAPRDWTERGYNIQRWTHLPSGGHFAAWEEPELLAKDLRESLRSFRNKA
ncbi:epoxide hydrolase [bacterium]|nr:epoxide hydrolase [bacterium]